MVKWALNLWIILKQFNLKVVHQRHIIHWQLNAKGFTGFCEFGNLGDYRLVLFSLFRCLHPCGNSSTLRVTLAPSDLMLEPAMYCVRFVMWSAAFWVQAGSPEPVPISLLYRYASISASFCSPPTSTTSQFQ